MFKVKIKVGFTLTKHTIQRKLMDMGYRSRTGLPIHLVYDHVAKMENYDLSKYLISEYDIKYIRCFLINILLRQGNHFSLESLETSLSNPSYNTIFDRKDFTTLETFLEFCIGINEVLDAIDIRIKMLLSFKYNKAYIIRPGQIPRNVIEIDGSSRSTTCKVLYLGRRVREEIMLDGHYTKLSKHKDSTLCRHVW